MTKTFEGLNGGHLPMYVGQPGRIVLAGIAVILQVLLCAPAAQGQNFGNWSQAESVDPNRLMINTSVNDGCPIEAPDGLTLFFASSRTDGAEKPTMDLDIWVAYRGSEDQPWAEVERLPAPVNSLADEFCPTPLPGNRLLFVSTRQSACSGVNTPDIYLTQHHPFHGWLTPQPLCEVNSTTAEFSPSYVEAGGLTMLYFSSNRADGTNHKIYVSVLQADGTWGTPDLVDELNMGGASDARPNVRKDGLEIVFDSTRAGSADIYTSTRTSVSQPWSSPQRLSAAVNHNAAAESRPSISRDGTRLYFGSTRDNVTGDSGADIFMSTRSGPDKK